MGRGLVAAGLDALGEVEWVGVSLVGLPADEEDEWRDWWEGLERSERVARALLVFSRARAAKDSR